ncbi:MAG: PepSY-associated TM helix domain-containing protein, partial [Bacteroidota bacterium]
MDWKGLNKRAYNILFHTHTVAGIAISFGLFIIFYAGSYALFRHEIYQWENPNARFEAPTDFDLDQVVASVKNHEPLFAETEQFSIAPPSEEMPFIQFFGAAYIDETREETKRFKGLINSENNYAYTDLSKPKTTVGDTLYHLHYFRQIPMGLYISGLVALFFLFASITGILIHWRSMVSKFYAFTMYGKWKQIWSNAHTVLGVIGLPFQVMYAITGALFGLLTLLLIPSALVLFGGNTEKILATVRPETAIKVSKNACPATSLSLQALYESTRAKYPNHELRSLRVSNYGKDDGYSNVYLDDKYTINGTGQVTYDLTSGVVLSETDPAQKTERVYVF